MQFLPVQYAYGLVVVSILISMLAAYAAFSLADRMRLAETPLHRALWLLGGSSAMGVGIWSMHYLGMLALRLPVPVYYYVPTVILSLMLAIAASAVALLVVSADEPGWRKLVAGGLLMGIGIGSMHYIGMAAMRSSAMHIYSRNGVLISLVVAAVAGTLSLRIGFTVRSRDGEREILRVAAAAVMGLGIAAMHYTAMHAASFRADKMPFSKAWSVRISALGETGVIVVTALILVTALTTAAFEKRRFRHLHGAHQELAASQEKLLQVQQQLREANALLSELSIRDGLTGLYNRRHFDSVAEVEWGRARRQHSWISLLMLDADNFKNLNDTYGHQRGDECLRAIARALDAESRRNYDIAARYGGEEFAIMLPGANTEGALQVAEVIRRAVRDLDLKHSGTAAGIVTISIGVCSCRPQVDDQVETMVRDADTALYLAKQRGRDRVEVAGRVPVEV